MKFLNDNPKTVIVTGARSGIGAAIADALEVWGHSVYRADLPELDVRNPGVIARHIDILVNCAGTNRLDWLGDVKEADWHRIMDTNAMGILKMTQACLDSLRARRGTVLNITSDAAWRPMRTSIAYNASKAAAHMMTIQMARELHDVTVFGIAPGPIAGTGMSEQVAHDVLRTRGQNFPQVPCIGGDIDLATLAEFVAFLLSDKRRHAALSGCIIPYGAVSS